MTHRMTVNQQVQLGAEVVPGTSVVASRLVEAFTWTLGAKSDVKTFRATGRRHNAVAEENTEYSEGKLSGEMDYNGIIYPVSMMFGKITPVLHSPSTSVYDWIIKPPLTGATSVQTFTLQQGDGINEAEGYGYVMANGFGYKITRKEATCSAELFGQLMSTGIVMTASPTAVALQPLVGKHANIYLDTTSAGIGTSQLTNVLEFDINGSGYYTQFWPLNRANGAFLAHIDTAPKLEAKLLLEADSEFVSILGYLQNSSKCYLRVDCQGPVIDSLNSIHAEFKHDMCLVPTNISSLEDKEGVYAVEYTFEFFEDTAWNSGQAHQMTMTNLLSAY